jgi:hypothetical protein
MTHSMTTFLGAMAALLFALVLADSPSFSKCIILAVFGAILGYSLFPIGNKIKHKARKD